jgi:two-component system copper resistance phosphate regulon response regulator CusR
MRVLVVDDDPKLRGYLCAGLRESGMACETAADARSALEVLGRVRSEPFDVLLLDVMMPARDGWDLLQDLREAGRETPVIFVTARDSVEERVKGLRLGADDYIIKPFALEELLARIQAVVRRRRALEPVEYADLRIDLAQRAVWRAGQPIDLSPREFDLLRVLLARRDAVVPRTDLLRDVWGIDFDPGTNTVDVHIARLRRKIERRGRPLIRTVRGEGYMLAENDHA